MYGKRHCKKKKKSYVYKLNLTNVNVRRSKTLKTYEEFNRKPSSTIRLKYKWIQIYFFWWGHILPFCYKKERTYRDTENYGQEKNKWVIENEVERTNVWLNLRSTYFLQLISHSDRNPWQINKSNLGQWSIFRYVGSRP